MSTNEHRMPNMATLANARDRLEQANFKMGKASVAAIMSSAVARQDAARLEEITKERDAADAAYRKLVADMTAGTGGTAIETGDQVRERAGFTEQGPLPTIAGTAAAFFSQRNADDMGMPSPIKAAAPAEATVINGQGALATYSLHDQSSPVAAAFGSAGLVTESGPAPEISAEFASGKGKFSFSSVDELFDTIEAADAADLEADQTRA